MKKYCTVILLVFAVVVMGSLYHRKLGLPNNMDNVLKVSFPWDRAVEEYDPARIFLAPEYIFLENIYSPLIEFSSSGEIVSGIAERFEWIENEAHFKIRENFKTVDDWLITAEDAAFSLKRLFIKSSNTHGNLKDVLCPKISNKNNFELCERIKVQGNTLILKFDEQVNFLFPMLAALDFAVIPQRAVDQKTLEIVNYRNTSGVYYVSNDDRNGNIELMPNKGHYHYGDKIPQKVVLVPCVKNQGCHSLNLFNDGKIDFITTVDSTPSEDILKFTQEHKEISFFKTMDIRNINLAFTMRGIKELTSNERLSIGKTIKKAFFEYYNGFDGYRPTEQYFPSFGEGGLAEEQLKVLRKKMDTIEPINDGKGVEISFVRFLDKNMLNKIISPWLSNVKLSEIKNPPGFENYKTLSEMPHVFINQLDSGFLEDIGLLSYLINAGMVGLSLEDGKKWLANYMKIKNKVERLELLRTLHFNALKNGIFFPIAACPYYAIARQPWEIRLSPYYANNQLWLITKN